MVGIINHEELFKDYLKEYGRLIFSICYSMTGDYFEAEDLAQEAFLSAYKNYNHFDGGNFKAWLTKIAANKCCDYLKKASRRTDATDDRYFENFAETRASPEDQLINKDVEDRLLHICKQLKEPYKTIATKHFYFGLSVSQISSETGKKYKTLQTQVYRTKAMLKKIWKEEFL